MKGQIITSVVNNQYTFSVVGQNTVIRPPYKHFSKGLTFFPVHIGDHVIIEEVDLRTLSLTLA